MANTETLIEVRPVRSYLRRYAIPLIAAAITVGGQAAKWFDYGIRLIDWLSRVEFIQEHLPGALSWLQYIVSPRGADTLSLLGLVLFFVSFFVMQYRKETKVIRGGDPLGTSSRSELAARQETTHEETERVKAEPPVLIEPGLAQIENTKTDLYSGEVANLYRSTSDDPNNTLMVTEVAFAKFRRDDESPVSSVKAKATIEFFNSRGESCFKIDRAFWWSKDNEHDMEAWFGVGDTQKMIIALVASEGRVFPYSGHYVAVERIGLGFRQEFVLEPREALTAQEYLVRIEITGTKDGLRRVKQSYDYDLIVRPRAEFKLRQG